MTKEKKTKQKKVKRVKSDPSVVWGRPTKITEEILQKLEKAFLQDATHVQACQFAGIGVSTLERYIEKFPEFRRTIDLWRSDTNFQAKIVVRDAIRKGSVETAKWRLEKTDPQDYASKTIQENIGDTEQVVFVLPENGLGQKEFEKKTKK